MAGSAQFARIKSDVLAITTKITLGRVATHKQIGQHLKVEPRHVAYILSTLDAAPTEQINDVAKQIHDVGQSLGNLAGALSAEIVPALVLEKKS